jgi:hypothetical protein
MQKERGEIMPSLMATSLLWRTHSAQTDIAYSKNSAGGDGGPHSWADLEIVPGVSWSLIFMLNTDI